MGSVEEGGVVFRAERTGKVSLGRTSNLIFFSFSFPFSYDSSGTSKDEIKERFAQTMEFVEEYLRDVVCQRFPFSDKEKNKLTFEVTLGEVISVLCLFFIDHFSVG